MGVGVASSQRWLWLCDAARCRIITGSPRPCEVIKIMPPIALKTCSFLGSDADEEGQPDRLLPPDHGTRPFQYLPPKIILSDAELDLARRYEQGDFSGGYLTSQNAYIRRGPPAEEHRKRREKFRWLKAEVERLGLTLPEAYMELVQSDDFVARLRHNSIWLRLPDELVPLPASPERKLFLIFREGQGCGYWYLLLAPDGGHIVAFSEEPLGLRNAYSKGDAPDPATVEIFQCAETFTQWIVNFFVACREEDVYYDQLLARHPGM
jgi:hypothetical protein